MEVDLNAFHFLRPWWLLGLIPAVLIWWAQRQQRASARHGLTVNPTLLPFLTVRSAGTRGPRPVDLLALTLSLSALAAAGPTWERDKPGYLDDVAPLVVAVDISRSMDGTDVPPSRIDAAKRLVRDLGAHRAGTKTGLIAYAGSSYLVLPPTEDTELLDLFAQALATDLTSHEGRDIAGTISLAAKVLSTERAGGSLLLLTDGANPQNLPEVRKRAQAAPDLQILVMAVGHAGDPPTGIDTAAMQQLAQAAGLLWAASPAPEMTSTG